MLDREKVDKLEYAWRHGHRLLPTVKAIGCSWFTGKRYFLKFEAAGIPRGEIRKFVRPRGRPGRRPWLDELPVYNGPTMIGTAITPPTPPVGPEWIGKPLGAHLRLV